MAGMAEPTLRDVLEALSKLADRVERIDANMATKSELANVRSDVQNVRTDVARVDGKVEAVRADVAAHRAETAKGFADLDLELSKHTDVHRELEKDVETIKRRPARTAARPARRR